MQNRNLKSKHIEKKNTICFFLLQDLNFLFFLEIHINFHLYKENRRNEEYNKYFSVQCTIRFGHVFWIYLIERFNFFYSETTTTVSDNEITRLSIFVFCLHCGV